MRDHFLLQIKKHPVASATTYKDALKKALTKSKCPGNSLETHLSVDIRSTISRKTWKGDREKYLSRL
jgi:hypothetical protein